jgi:hypothetical protein
MFGDTGDEVTVGSENYLLRSFIISNFHQILLRNRDSDWLRAG